MINFLTSDLTRNFALGFVAGAIVLAVQSGNALSSFIPAAIAGVIS